MKNAYLYSCLFAIITSVSFLSSCSSSEESAPVDPDLLEGRFLDTAVEGLGYTTFIETGTNTYTSTRPQAFTDRNGRFYYKAGELIKFAVGNIELHDMLPGKSIITPHDMTISAYPNRPYNIAAFLQSLDNDNNLSNGILINSAVTQQANTYTSSPGFNLGFNSGMPAIIAELTALTDAGTRSMIDPGTAASHLNNTINSAAPGNYPFIYGYYTGTYSISVSNCSDPADNGTYTFTVELIINQQSNDTFSGLATGSIDISGNILNEYLTYSGTISMTGELTGSSTHSFLNSGGSGTFTGQLNGDTLNMTNTGSDTYGDTCSYTRNMTVSR